MQHTDKMEDARRTIQAYEKHHGLPPTISRRLSVCGRHGDIQGPGSHCRCPYVGTFTQVPQPRRQKPAHGAYTGTCSHNELQRCNEKAT